MKAVVVKALGGPECLQIAEVEMPLPAAGEVTVKLSWAGVNFIDIYMRDGTYAQSATYPSQLPLTLGMEGAGTVEAVGKGVTDLTVGQPVAYCLARGSYAQYACVPAWRVVPVPVEISLATAAALMLQGCTAHYLTRSTFALKSGDSCLIHAGAGGVGQLLIQLAKERGAVVFATVGNAEKADIARRRGAAHCILTKKLTSVRPCENGPADAGSTWSTIPWAGLLSSAAYDACDGAGFACFSASVRGRWRR